MGEGHTWWETIAKNHNRLLLYHISLSDNSHDSPLPEPLTGQNPPQIALSNTLTTNFDTNLYIQALGKSTLKS